jgi:hypothetical protein
MTGQQVADVSWWPKQSTWEGSGRDVGYWASDNEEWYQMQLEDIQNYLKGRSYPKKILRNAKEWRNTLKGYKRETKKITDHNHQAAKEFLHSV